MQEQGDLNPLAYGSGGLFLGFLNGNCISNGERIFF
jgi:hypothetical protein